MRIAFSTIGCPTWDLGTIIAKAKEFGYAGVELRGLNGQLHLPLAAELTADPAATRGRFADAGIQLICLSSSAAFHSRDAHEVADNKAQVRDYIDTAHALGCPYVRVFGAEIPTRFPFGHEPRERVLTRIVAALRDLAPYAESRGVSIVLENSGDFCGSEDLWYLVDAAESAAVKACWSTVAGRSVRERPTISIPRLGTKIVMLHACDAKFDDHGRFDGYVPLGEGACEIPRTFELLKGLGFNDWLVFDWPKLWNTSLSDPDKAFPTAVKYLKDLIAQKPIVLTAYKGDKNAPKFKAREASEPARASSP